MLVLCSYMSSLTTFIYLSTIYIEVLPRIFNSFMVIIFFRFQEANNYMTVIKTELQVSHMLGKWSTTKLHCIYIFLYMLYIVCIYIYIVLYHIFLFYIVYIIFSFPFNLPVSLACYQKYCSQQSMAVISLRTQFQFHQIYNQRIIG